MPHTALFKRHLLSILMPVYNERAFLRRCVDRVLAAPLPEGVERELVIVDDASTDGTREIIADLAAQHPDVIRAFRQEPNQGKGAAIRRAVEEMRGEYAIFQDADLEYDPQEYPLVLQPLVEGIADAVYGSRFAPRHMRRVFNYHHALGNRFLTSLSNMTTGLDLTDMETCYKAFKADVLKTIPLRSNRFGIEPEITAKIAKRGCAVYEVPISYRGRDYTEGKKIGWKDGFSAIWTIFKYWVMDDCFNEQYGHSILHSLSHARRFNRWMVKVITRHMGQRILEVGSGIGSISRLLPKREKLIVTDMDPTYLDILENAFDGNEVVSVRRLDLTSGDDVGAVGAGCCDTVVCLNVLEHIEDDVDALEHIRTLLEPGGRAILLVPQYEWLYGSYDKVVDHHRRYSRRTLRERLAAAGLAPVRMFNFNALSIPGWWVNSCLLKRTTMSRVQLKLYDMMVPVLRVVEGILPLPGLSLICVAERRDRG